MGECDPVKVFFLLIYFRQHTSALRMLAITVSLGLLVLTSAQSIGFGKCPKNVKVQQDFDITKYVGKWYEIQSIPATFQYGWSCVSAEYSLNDDGTAKVYNKGKKPSGEYEDIEGVAIIPDPSEAAKIGVRFFEGQPYADYWVLDTDYETYTLVYTCSDITVSNVRFLWILAREKTLDDATVARLKALAAGYGIRADKLNVTSQKDC